MNAIIGLCHFCEAHGPRPLFCTFTTDDEKHTVEASPSSAQCTGCKSLGADTVIVSKDVDGTIYCSRECVPNSEVTSFLRHAAVRSITCEVSWNKEGGIVYFGDNRGHVLSLTFQLKDTRARGLKRWFSIVVLMKDKMLLLNLTPVLSEHMKKLAKELQNLAEGVFDEEQKICSQRALRLNTGRNDFGPSRSLPQLTGDEDIFKKIHSNFTWMLKAGALTYTETLYTSQDLINMLHTTDAAGTMFDMRTCLMSTNDGMSLRALEVLLGKNIFRIILYCTLTGITVIVKSIKINSNEIIKGLSRLVPVQVENIPNLQCCNSNEHISSTAGLCILEELENTFKCNWPGVLPAKCPTLMNRIESAIANPSFSDDVLNQHIKSLQLEWLGTARTIKLAIESSKSKDAITKLKQVLGITMQDELLINYWNERFCS